MFKRIRGFLQSPVYARELRARGCRDQAAFITLWVFVAALYVEMILLVLGAALDKNFLGNMIGFAIGTGWVLDIGCRLLGVILTVDTFNGERSLRTLDGLVLSPVPRATVVFAKLLARLHPLRLPLLAMVPGLVVFPPMFAFLFAPELPVADPTAAHGGLGQVAGLALTAFTVSLYPVISAAAAIFFGSAIGMFYSLAIKNNGMAVGLSFATVLILSLGYCFLSYFVIVFGGIFTAATIKTHPALGTLPALVLILEEVISRGLPGFLLLLWAVNDFDRLARD